EIAADLRAPRSETPPRAAALALSAISAWGEAALDRIVGPFALAAWDRERRRLLCARDYMGLRPLFHHLDDRLFVFASDLHALFEERSIPHEVNEGVAAEYLAGGGPAT